MATFYDHAKTQFALNWHDKVQQKMSRLKERVTVDEHQGDRKRYPIVADEEWAARTRLQSSSPSEATVTFRNLTTTAYKKYLYFDEDDDTFLLGEMESPTSSLLRVIGNGYNRLCDSTIYTALGANRATGADGTGSSGFPAGQSIDVNYVRSGSAVNSGLTLDKLIKTRSLLGENEVTDPDEPTELVFVCRQAQLDDLLDDPKVQDFDYNSVRALVNGQVNTWMGFRFVRYQPATVSTVDVATCYAYHKDYVVFNPGKRKVRVDILPTTQHARQVGGYARMGAMVLEDEAVVRVYADQSP